MERKLNNREKKHLKCMKKIIRKDFLGGFWPNQAVTYAISY